MRGGGGGVLCLTEVLGRCGYSWGYKTTENQPINFRVYIILFHRHKALELALLSKQSAFSTEFTSPL